jgi:hypothetical protein
MRKVVTEWKSKVASGWQVVVPPLKQEEEVVIEDPQGKRLGKVTTVTEDGIALVLDRGAFRKICP